MAVFVSDAFTGTDGATLVSRAGATGATWAAVTSTTGGFLVLSNRVYCSPAIAWDYASGTPANADYTVDAVVRIVTTETGTACNLAVAARMDTAARTAYIAGLEWPGSTTVRIRLRSIVANVTGTLNVTAAITDPTPGTDHTMGLRVFGSSIAAFWDGVQVASGTNSEITAAGKAGLYGNRAATTTTGWHLDSFTAADYIAPAPTDHGMFFADH